MLESRQNKIVKKIESLKNKRDRDKTGLFVVEGERFVSEIPDKSLIDLVAFSETYAKNNDIEKYFENGNAFVISDAVFKYCSDTENPQGILAVCKKQEKSLKGIIKNKDNGFYIVAEELNDPGNLGTIIRTADASAVDGIILTRGSVDLYNPKVLRSTMGAIFHIDICQNCDISETVSMLKEKGVSVYAGHLKGEKYPYDLDLKKGTAFMIGNEARGLSDKATSLCDELVKIPIPGKAESLNASMAGGILMYEVVRQRLV